MKRITICIILASFAAFPTIVRAEQVTVTVKGMVCSFCAQGIKKTFLRKDGVSSVDVDLDKKIVSITTVKGATLKDSEIQQSIVDSGFEVISIERKADA